MNIFAHIWLIVILSVFPPNIEGLRCHTCYPCDEDTPGTVETCDPTPYAALPDKGYMACSFEHGASGFIRKRCRFIRDDPDKNVGLGETTCYSSPLIESENDCICFTNDCNKYRPFPDPEPQPTENTPPTESSASKFRGTSTLIAGLLTTLLCKKYLGQVMP